MSSQSSWLIRKCFRDICICVAWSWPGPVWRLSRWLLGWGRNWGESGTLISLHTGHLSAFWQGTASFIATQSRQFRAGSLWAGPRPGPAGPPCTHANCFIQREDIQIDFIQWFWWRVYFDLSQAQDIYILICSGGGTLRRFSSYVSILCDAQGTPSILSEWPL